MNKAKVAFQLNGGLGTYIMEMNFVQCFYDKFAESVEISVFSFAEEMSLELYGKQYFVTRYGSRKEFVKDDYDLAIEMNWFAKVVKCNDNALKEADSTNKLFRLVRKWRDFAKADITKHFFTPNTNMFDSQIYIMANSGRQNRLQLADIDGTLRIEKKYRFTITTENDDEVLEKFRLNGTRYITIQQGVNASSNTKQFSPKQWPNRYYAKLCEICHERFPDIKLVQLGEAENNLPVEGVDLCLLGETAMSELKSILKNAILHVDGDCGMVHIRRAMHTTPNIAMYGDHPGNIYGYDEDFRVKSDVCKIGCGKLFDAWKRKCYLGGEAKCMTAIQPEQIADIIGNFLKMLEKGEYETDMTLPQYPPKEKTVLERLLEEPDITFDKDWVNWLMSHELYDYRVVKAKAKNMIFSKLTSNGYVLVPLTRCPAYRYMQGEKDAYAKYMKLHEKYAPNSERSTERFEELVKSLDANGFDMRNLVVVNCNCRILDGAHRASWLMNKYGEDYEMTVLKIYGNF